MWEVKEAAGAAELRKERMEGGALGRMRRGGRVAGCTATLPARAGKKPMGFEALLKGDALWSHSGLCFFSVPKKRSGLKGHRKETNHFVGFPYSPGMLEMSQNQHVCVMEPADSC